MRRTAVRITYDQPGQSARVVFRQVPLIARTLWYGGGVMANLRIVSGTLLVERPNSSVMNSEFVERSPIRYDRRKRKLRDLRAARR